MLCPVVAGVYYSMAMTLLLFSSCFISFLGMLMRSTPCFTFASIFAVSAWYRRIRGADSGPSLRI